MHVTKKRDTKCSILPRTSSVRLFQDMHAAEAAQNAQRH
jgi:hypothetical protein